MNGITNEQPGVPGKDPDQAADDVKRRASESAAKVGDNVRQTADRVKDAATATAQQVGDRVKEQAKQTGDKIKEQSRSFLNEQKGRVGSDIQTYSAAARQAAERLQGEGDTNVAQYVSTAADRLDGLGRRIQERDLPQLVDDVEEIARRRPEIFFGGMFVAGLAAARFLKASKQRRQRDRYNSNDQFAMQRPPAGVSGGNVGSAGSTIPTSTVGAPTAWPTGQAGTERGGTI